MNGAILHNVAPICSEIVQGYTVYELINVQTSRSFTYIQGVKKYILFDRKWRHTSVNITHGQKYTKNIHLIYVAKVTQIVGSV